VVLFGRRVFWASALWVLSSVVLIVPQAFSQTDEIPPWQRCSPSSGTEPGEQCTSEGRLTGRALSDAYTLRGMSQLFPLLYGSSSSSDDPEHIQQERNRRALNLLLVGSDFNQAIEIDPSNLRARVCRGITSLAQGDISPAIASLSEAIRLAPKDYEVLIARARAYAMKQTFQRAIDDLNRAIEIDPMKASAFVFRGDVYQALGRPHLAYADYSTAVKLEPDVADWVKRRDGAAKFVGRRIRTKMASRYVRDVFRAGLARATDSQAVSKVSDTVKRWENGEVSLQEAMQAFDGGNPRCVLAYP